MSGPLANFADDVGQVFARNTLLDIVWGCKYIGDRRTVDIHIWSLRQEIEAELDQPKHIITLRGAGYKLAE